MGLDIDEILERIGPNGRYQIRTVTVLGWIVLSMAMYVLSSTFVGGEPAWRCSINSTVCTTKVEYSVGVEGYKERCLMNRSDWEFVDDFTSIVTEWDLVCDRSILNSLASSLFFAGFLISASLFGYISDRFGRKKALFFGILMTNAINFSAVFSTNFKYYLIARFGVGLFGGGLGLIIFVICFEITGVKHRGTSGVFIWAFWVLGSMVLAPFAYFLRDWRDLYLAISVVMLTTVIMFWWIPETPRWLVVNGRTDEAEVVLRKIATFNGTQYPDETIEVHNPERKNVRKSNCFDIFRAKGYANITFIQWFAWAVNALVYYCVSLGTANVGGNMYLTFFLLSLVEMPATLATIYFILKLGRKWSVIGGMWLAALFSVLTAVFPMHSSLGYTAGRIIMSVSAKFMVTVSFNAMIVWSGEIYPTIIRNVATGSCSSMARLGSFASSFVNHLAQINIWLPYIVMAVASFPAGTLCLYLPETRGVPTPEDFESEETFTETLINANGLEAQDCKQNIGQFTSAV